MPSLLPQGKEVLAAGLRGTGRDCHQVSATGSNGSQTVWPHTRKYQVFGEPDREGNEQKHPNVV